VFDTLSPHSSWLGDGRLQINGYELPDRDLRLLDEPRSTTQLAALTGLPPGAVSNHLRVLLGADAVLRRRAGREVLYWRTALGHVLAASGRTGTAEHPGLERFGVLGLWR
jgi:DNA-binding transcriptional ArsR family regulator